MTRPPVPAGARSGWVLLLAGSSSLLLYAATSPTRPPVWVGVIDVGVAVLLVLLVARWARDVHPGSPVTALRRTTRVQVALWPALLLSLWLARDAVDLDVLLPGLAWCSALLARAVPWLLERPAG